MPPRLATICIDRTSIEPFEPVLKRNEKEPSDVLRTRSLFSLDDLGLWVTYRMWIDSLGMQRHVTVDPIISLKTVKNVVFGVGYRSYERCFRI